MKLYGKNGRTFRSLWMLEEAGVAYERELVDFSTGDTQSAEFLAINPNGKIPVLQDEVDGESITLFESLAINYHIARYHAPQYWLGSAAGSVGESYAVQWLAWALGEFEGPHDAANRTNTKIDSERLQRSMIVLRRALTDRPYILGDEFSVIDLNTACMGLRPQYQPIFAADKELCDWFERCTSRPAMARAGQMAR